MEVFTLTSVDGNGGFSSKTIFYSSNVNSNQNIIDYSRTLLFFTLLENVPLNKSMIYISYSISLDGQLITEL